MTKDRCVDNSLTVGTLNTRTVCCSLPDHYPTYELSAGEAAHYKAKALGTDNTLLEGLPYVARLAHSSSICSAHSRLPR